MNKSFYRWWLPVSIGIHLVMLVLLQLIPMSIASSDDRVDPNNITVTVMDTPSNRAPDRPVEAIAPVIEHHTTQSTTYGIPRPRTTHGTSISETKDIMPGPGKKPAAPPKVMTAENGNWEVRPGLNGSNGSNGTDKGTGGPSYGAAAEGGPTPTYPKLALDRGSEGTVVVSVTVGPHGEIVSTSINESPGDADLENTCLHAARAWRFKPAIQNGKPVQSTTQLRFRFAHGKVII